jgi:hypothetical protein
MNVLSFYLTLLRFAPPGTARWPGKPAARTAATTSAPAALAADTLPTVAPLPECVTPAEGWPLKRVKVADGVVDVPDVLVRG